ncbi:hypothetical protein [Streptomyces sp. NPDC096339]|uniref:hypothetical protein n=1 Tax=Streptomyces sp. NPDC096339 TaxID=3366086 RepID=UPI00380AD08B
MRRRRIRVGMAVAVMGLLSMTAGCIGDEGAPPDPQGQGPAKSPGPGKNESKPPAGKTPSTAPDSSPATEPPQGDIYISGTLEPENVTTSDGEKVACVSGIQAGVKVKPVKQKATWRAVALTRPLPTGGRLPERGDAKGVLVNPSAGTLTPGSTANIHVGGTFDKNLGSFYLVIQNGANTTTLTMHYTCIPTS